jgi:hypothetical protein
LFTENLVSSPNEKFYDSLVLCILRAVQSKNVGSHRPNVSAARFG